MVLGCLLTERMARLAHNRHIAIAAVLELMQRLKHRRRGRHRIRRFGHDRRERRGRGIELLRDELEEEVLCGGREGERERELVLCGAALSLAAVLLCAAEMHIPSA